MGFGDRTQLAHVMIDGVASVDQASGLFKVFLASLGAGEDPANNRLRIVGVDGAGNVNLWSIDSAGSLQVDGPKQWSVVSTPAAGAQATASKAAGGGTVKHVAVEAIITWGAIAAPVATALLWNLRDGASGAGTILASGQLAVPAAVFQGPPQIVPLNIVGSANTAMTLEVSAALANLLEGVTLLGYDLPS